ncbi:MAG TPA: hypothetical protein VN039_15745 [Nitrospira sp.]|jgi:hypothetical protein|nr:hypothetical protein [Nitrospira sp.]
MNITMGGYLIDKAVTDSRRVSIVAVLLQTLAFAALSTSPCAFAQNASAASGASSVRSFAGGVAPLFTFPGGSLYIDNQGTQGFLHTPGQNFESFSFRNPTTGQAWSGAAMTFGPQLSIGLIQGANQVGNSTVLPGPPPQTSPLPPIESGILDEIP